LPFHDLKSQGKVREFDYRRPVATLAVVIPVLYITSNISVRSADLLLHTVHKDRSLLKFLSHCGSYILFIFVFIEIVALIGNISVHIRI